MSTPLIDKSFEGMLRQMRREITLLWRRIGKNTNSGGGTTSERDALFGVPGGSVPNQVALANQQVVWLNVDKGWTETYYAVSGSSGLTVRGLVPGTPAGWYPVAGSNLTATRIQQNGFQGIGAGGIYGTTFSAGFFVNIGGFTAPTANQIQVPYAGLYDIVGAVYFSGGGVSAYLNALVQDGPPGGTFIDTVAARVPGGAADAQVIATGMGIRFGVDRRVALGAQSQVNHNIYGDGIHRRTWLSLSYRGPNLVDN